MREYGGYLPLEICQGHELYRGEDVVSLNCGRNAIVYAALAEKYSKLYIPLWTCESIQKSLDQYGIYYETYHIDGEFMPIDVTLEENESILWTNYFGLIDGQKIEALIRKYHNNVIIDNTQAFFAKPHMAVYNIYSCRKFVGVSDGAYIVKKNIKKINLAQDNSYQRVGYLLKSIECGTNGSYMDYKEAERSFDNLEVMKMSKITSYILGGVDYEYIKEKRRENYLTLYNEFYKINELDLPMLDDMVPMVYPLLVVNEKLREELVSMKIWIPQWWKYILEKYCPVFFEQRLCHYLFPLPIDQRYSSTDMKQIAHIVKSCIKMPNYCGK